MPFEKKTVEVRILELFDSLPLAEAERALAFAKVLVARKTPVAPKVTGKKRGRPARRPVPTAEVPAAAPQADAAPVA